MPFDPNDKAKVLYDAVSKDYDLGTYDEFKTKLQDPNKRKVLYDAIGKDYDLGDYNAFNQKLGFDSKGQLSNPAGVEVADLNKIANMQVGQPKQPDAYQMKQQEMAKTNEAIHNTIQRNNELANKPTDLNSPEYQKQFQELAGKKENNDVAVVNAKDGKPFVVPTSGFLKNAGNAFIESLKAPVEAVKQLMMNDKELQQHFEQRQEEQPYLPESVPSPIGGIGASIGGIPKIAAELAIPYVGEVLAVTETELSSTGTHTEELYNRSLDELKQKNGDPNYEPTEEEKIAAANRARKDAPLAAAPDAAMVLALNSLGGNSLKLNASAKSFSQTLNKFAGQTVKMAALGGASEGARSGMEALLGYNVTGQEALKNIGEGAYTWGLMDAMFKVAPLVGNLPKAAQAVWKEYMSNVPKPVFEEATAEMGADGAEAKKMVNDYEKAKKSVPDHYSDEHKPILTDLVQKKQELEKKKETIDKAFHEDIDEQIEHVDNTIKVVKNSSNPIDIYTDDPNPKAHDKLTTQEKEGIQVDKDYGDAETEQVGKDEEKRFKPIAYYYEDKGGIKLKHQIEVGEKTYTDKSKAQEVADKALAKHYYENGMPDNQKPQKKVNEKVENNQQELQTQPEQVVTDVDKETAKPIIGEIEQPTTEQGVQVSDTTKLPQGTESGEQIEAYHVFAPNGTQEAFIAKGDNSKYILQSTRPSRKGTEVFKSYDDAAKRATEIFGEGTEVKPYEPTETPQQQANKVEQPIEELRNKHEEELHEATKPVIEMERIKNKDFAKMEDADKIKQAKEKHTDIFRRKKILDKLIDCL